MDLEQQLRILEAAQGSPALLTLSAVDLAHPLLPEPERAQIRRALLAAAVPHWCDREFLGTLLQATKEESERLLGQLRALSAIEPFPARGENAVNVHGASRLTLREHLRQTDDVLWKEYARRAHGYLRSSEKPHARVEALYHHFAIDPAEAAAECERLTQDFAAFQQPEMLSALVPTLQELATANWLDAKARSAIDKLRETVRHPPDPLPNVSHSYGVDTRSVFISYHHESPEHMEMVRALAQRLHEEKLPVEFDEMYLAEHPGGPEEGWPKWCEDRATESEAVLVVASPGWFAAYEQRGLPETGHGLAAEARVFRQKIYHDLGMNARVRFVELTTSEDCTYPPSLSGWRRFRLTGNSDVFPEIAAWVRQRLAIGTNTEPKERVVYLADVLPTTAGSSAGLRCGLAEELADRGWTVLPAQDYAAEGYAERVRQELRQTIAFIQILQTERVERDDRDFIQYLEAMNLGVKCLRYRDPDLNLASVQDVEKRAFLSSDPNVRPIQFDEFKKEVFRILEEIWAKLQQTPATVAPSTSRTQHLVRVVVEEPHFNEGWDEVVRSSFAHQEDIAVETVHADKEKSEALIRLHRARPCQGFLFVHPSSDNLNTDLRQCVEIQLDLKDKAPPVGIITSKYNSNPPPTTRPLPIKFFQILVTNGPSSLANSADYTTFLQAVREVSL